jgi:hypothetical protein
MRRAVVIVLFDSLLSSVNMARFAAATLVAMVWVIPTSAQAPPTTEAASEKSAPDWGSWRREVLDAVQPATAEQRSAAAAQAAAQLAELAAELDRLPEGQDIRNALQWERLAAAIADNAAPSATLYACYVTLRRVRAPAVQAGIDQLRLTLGRMHGQALLAETPDWETVVREHVATLVRILPVDAATRSGDEQRAAQDAYAWLATTRLCTPQLAAARARLSFPNQWMHVSGDFLASMSSRQLEHPFTVSESVGDTQVQGRGVIRVRPDIRLQPDDARGSLRIRVLGHGDVPITAVSRPATVQALTRVSFSADQIVSITPLGVELPPASVDADSHTTLQGVGLHMRSCLVRRLLQPVVERVAQRKLAEGDVQAREKARQQIEAGLSEGSVLLGAQVNDLLQRFFWQSLTTRDIEARARVRSTAAALSWSADYSSPTQLGAPTAAAEPPVKWDILLQFHDSSFNNTSAAIAGRRIDEPTFREVFFDLFRFEPVGEVAPTARIPAAMWLADDRPMELQFAGGAIRIQLRLQAIEFDNQRVPADITIAAQYALEYSAEGLALRRLGDLQIDVAQPEALAADRLNETLARFFLPLVRSQARLSPQRGGIVSVAYVNLDAGWLTLALARSTDPPAVKTLSSITTQPVPSQP